MPNRISGSAKQESLSKNTILSVGTCRRNFVSSQFIFVHHKNFQDPLLLSQCGNVYYKDTFLQVMHTPCRCNVQQGENKYECCPDALQVCYLAVSPWIASSVRACPLQTALTAESRALLKQMEHLPPSLPPHYSRTSTA